MLGPKKVLLGFQKAYVRSDFYLTNSRGHRLCCSHWQPLLPHPPGQLEKPSVSGPRGFLDLSDSEDSLGEFDASPASAPSPSLPSPPSPTPPPEQIPCIIYLHGNCGNRRDSLDLFQLLASYNISLFSFDFSGAGLSEGEYISLGYHEQDDLAVVVRHIQQAGRTSSIGLWGRSMGAVTAILYASLHPADISCLILDSPFSNLQNLAIDLVTNSVAQPVGCCKMLSIQLFVKLGLRVVGSSIQKKADFDIFEIDSVQAARRCQKPVLFFHGISDTFVRHSHSQLIFRNYAGEAKSLYLIPGDHNSFRAAQYFDLASIFLHRYLLSTPNHVMFPSVFLSTPIPPFHTSFFCKLLPEYSTDELLDPLTGSNILLCFSDSGIAFYSPYSRRCIRSFSTSSIWTFKPDGDRFLIKFRSEEIFSLWSPEIELINDHFRSLLHHRLPVTRSKLKKATISPPAPQLKQILDGSPEFFQLTSSNSDIIPSSSSSSSSSSSPTSNIISTSTTTNHSTSLPASSNMIEMLDYSDDAEFNENIPLVSTSSKLSKRKTKAKSKLIN